MKYLCLIYNEEKRREQASEVEVNAVLEACRDYDRELRANGRLIASEKLQPVATATTIRFADGNMSITDGPFAETKEQLGGFYLIEADDLDDAIRIAKDIPPARFGSLELRPIHELR